MWGQKERPYGAGRGRRASAARRPISGRRPLLIALQRLGDKHLRVFYELYRDRAAFDEHERQGHTARFLAEREQFLAAPPRVEFVTLLSGVGVAGGS